MRTIRAVYRSKISLETELEVETEVIVDDEQDVREAGREAMRVISEFTAGMAEEAAAE